MLVRATDFMPSWQRGYARSAGEALYPGLWRGLIGAWFPSLGPTGGTLFDISGYGNHGTLTNMDIATDWVPTEKGYALDFGAATDYVLMENVTSITDFPITMIVLGSPSDAGVHCGFSIADSTDNFNFTSVIINANKASSSLSTTFNYSVTGTISVPTGSWASVVWVCESVTDRRLYTNGILDGTDVRANAFLGAGVDRLSIGRLLRPSELDRDGRVAMALIYNRVLSPQEIMQLYIDPMALVRPKGRAFGVAQLVAAGIIPLIMAHSRRRR